MKQTDLTENLEQWNYISRYSKWMYDIYADFVGKRVFEIGAGQGRNIEFYIDKCEKVMAIDIFQNMIDHMLDKFKNYPCFDAELLDLEKGDLSQYVEGFDTVLCVNVLEHLSDDFDSVKRMKSLLCPGGHLVILVPAFQKLYCQMDKNVGHYRRYDPGRLTEIAQANDMKTVKHHYFNRLGIIPYYLKGRKKNIGQGESFSSSLNEANSKLYNMASLILEPIEKAFPPKKGISELIILEK